jgi:hypothetical protein
MNRMSAEHRWARRLAIPLLVLALTLAACSGPENRDDTDATLTTTAQATQPATPVDATPTATLPPTATISASPTLSASPTTAASPTANPASPTAASPTPVADIRELLPQLTELPGNGEGYTIAEEGTRSAQELANAYADSTAHLQRLNEWGFKQHVYRSFSRSDAVENQQLPYSILTTINVYGSPDQASAAVKWLKSLATAQGASEATAPAVGDEAVAVTQSTSSGVPTASVYIRQAATVYVYFAEGGDPLPAMSTIAQNVFTR